VYSQEDEEKELEATVDVQEYHQTDQEEEEAVAELYI